MTQVLEIRELETGVFKGGSDNDLPENWDKKDLYFYIQQRLTDIKNEEVFNQRNYYMKIRGYYPKNLLDGFFKCECCPYNNRSREEDYNQFIDEDDNMCVLILKSRYIDFRNFDIYSVRIDYDQNFKALQRGNNPLITIIKFYYEENTIWDKIWNWIKLKLNNDITF